MPLLQLPLTASPSSFSSSSSSSSCYSIPKLPIFSKKLHHRYSCRPTKSRVVVLVGSNEEATELSVSSTQEEPDPQDLGYIRQIKRVSFIFLLNIHAHVFVCLVNKDSIFVTVGVGASQKKSRYDFQWGHYYFTCTIFYLISIGNSQLCFASTHCFVSLSLYFLWHFS